MPEPFNYLFAVIFVIFVFLIALLIIYIPFLGFDKFKKKLNIKKDSLADYIFVYAYAITVVVLNFLIFNTGWLASFFN